MKRTLFLTISAISLTVAASVQAKAPGKPGEGFGPHLDLDAQGYGVISFVAPKGDQNCQKFFIEPTQAAKDENIKIEIVFNPRLVSNKKWEKDEEEIVWTGPLDQKVSLIYNHAGHRGVHGGAFAKDTHHHWDVRLKDKTYKSLVDFQKDLPMYANITGHASAHCGQGETSVSRQPGINLTYVTLHKD